MPKRKRAKKPAPPPPKKKAKNNEPKDRSRERGTAVVVPRQRESELPEGASIPPHSVFLHVVMNRLYVKVPLHHVPASCINFEPTSTGFHLDTLTFARKRYFLEFPYPHGITVKPEAAEATIEMSVLTAVLPISSIPRDVVTQELIKIESIREAKKPGVQHKKKKQRTEEEEAASVPEVTASNGGDKKGHGKEIPKASKQQQSIETKKASKKAQPAKKEKKVQGEKPKGTEKKRGPKAPTTTTEQLPEAQPKKKSKIQQEQPKKKTAKAEETAPASEESQQQQQKGKQVKKTSKQGKPKQQPEAKKSGKDADGEEEKGKKKRKRGDKKEEGSVGGNAKTPATKPKEGKPQKKEKEVEFVSVSKAKSIIEEINAKQDQDRAAKTQKEVDRKEFFAAKRQSRDEKKMKKRQKINELADQVKRKSQQQAKDHQPVKAPTKRRVGFQVPKDK